jgi:hypothetical protein
MSAPLRACRPRLTAAQGPGRAAGRRGPHFSAAPSNSEKVQKQRDAYFEITDSTASLTNVRFRPLAAGGDRLLSAVLVTNAYVNGQRSRQR